MFILSSILTLTNGNSIVHFLGGIGNLHKLYRQNNNNHTGAIYTLKDLYRFHVKFHQFMADGLSSSSTTTTSKPVVKNPEDMTKFWLNFQNFIFYPNHHHHHHHHDHHDNDLIPDDSWWWWWWPSNWENNTINCEDQKSNQ
nr:uncharacterized protein LOC124498982 [Dermatophagoides farinae]